MPLFAFGCPECDATRESFVHVAADWGCATIWCACGSSMGPLLSMGRGLTYFAEGRGRWIDNLGDQPVYVTSHEQHKAEMKKAGVEWATKWQTQRTGGWV